MSAIFYKLFDLLRTAHFPTSRKLRAPKTAGPAAAAPVAPLSPHTADPPSYILDRPLWTYYWLALFGEGIVVTVKQRQEFRIRLQKRARRVAERKLEAFEEERQAKTVIWIVHFDF